MIGAPLLIGAAFVAGLFVRDVFRYGYERYFAWKLERDFEASKLRMVGCKHERVKLVDCGTGPVTPKCQDCWALRVEGSFVLGDKVHGDGGMYWTPNTASPEQADKTTEDLRRRRAAS